MSQNTLKKIISYPGLLQPVQLSSKYDRKADSKKAKSRNLSPVNSSQSTIQKSFLAKVFQKPVEELLIKVTNYINETIPSTEIKQVLCDLGKGIQNLQRQVIVLEKQIREMSYMNEYMQISLNQKEKVYMEMVKDKIEDKQNLDYKTQQLQSIKMQQAQQLEKLTEPKPKNIYKEKRQPYISPQHNTPSKLQQSIDSSNKRHQNSNIHVSSYQGTPRKMNSSRIMVQSLNKSIFRSQQVSPNKKEEDSQQQAKQIDDQMLLKDEVIQIPLEYIMKKRQSDISPDRRKSPLSKDLTPFTIKQQSGLSKDVIDCAFSNAKVAGRRQTMSMYLRNDNENDLGSYSKQEFNQHNQDFQLFSKILDLHDHKTDEQLLEEHVDNDLIKQIKKLLMDENRFRKFILNIKKREFYNFYEGLLIMFARNNAAFKMILKLKNLIKGIISINVQSDLGAAFQTIIEETCKTLNCERASVFLIDAKRGELWTKLAKGSQITIKVQLGQGLAGYVGKSGETLNVLDAHQDGRFNREADRKSNFRTRSVLCVPIFKDQKQNQIIGVLQAINKENQGFFTKNDEGLIKIVAALAEPVLRNTLENDQKIEYENSQRQLFKLFKSLNSCRSLSQLLIHTQKNIENDFECRQARIFIEQDGKLIYHTQDGGEVIADSDVGIVGNVFQTGKAMIISCCYKHNLYNSLLDIETNMPVITLPVKDHYQKNKVIGVIQVVNPKGIENIVYSETQPSIPRVLEDTLEDISDMLMDLNLTDFNKVLQKHGDSVNNDLKRLSIKKSSKVYESEIPQKSYFDNYTLISDERAQKGYAKCQAPIKKWKYPFEKNLKKVIPFEEPHLI